jgi:hypothetical protein
MIARISDRRKGQRAMYRKDRLEYLREHPFCQIFIFRHRLSEKQVIEENGFVEGLKVPRSTQIHHRNKADGERLLNKKFWMASSFREHDIVESNKAEARRLGLLLPVQADKSGRWGDDQQALTTDELLAVRVRREF